jgi:hypothetical protein
MAYRDWMYTGFASKSDEWIRGVEHFVNEAFDPAIAKGSKRMPCPCSDCKNSKRKLPREMWKDIHKNGFMPNYTRWTLHGERDRMAAEDVRARLEDFDEDAGVADMMVDINEACDNEGSVEEDPEETAKAFYLMMDSAQKPLHENTTMSQLDGIGRLLALKSQLSLSRDGFDLVLKVLGTMLPEGHTLPKNTYESQKLLGALKMPYESIHSCPKGCVLFRGDDLKEATHCPKCKASRYVQVEGSDGNKKQSKIPEKVLRYLPVLPRLQRMYMTEESAK